MHLLKIVLFYDIMNVKFRILTRYIENILIRISTLLAIWVFLVFFEITYSSAAVQTPGVRDNSYKLSNLESDAHTDNCEILPKSIKIFHLLNFTKFRKQKPEK